MSDNIPFEIQAEIMQRLPVKSLIRFRSVSKPWKSLISSPEFIAGYNHIQQQQRLLVRYVDPLVYEDKYVSIIDDETFPQHKFPLTPPMSVKLINEPKLVGSSFGLFCLYNFYGNTGDSGTNTAVVWNPSIRKSVFVVVPHVLTWPYETMVGFGVCHKSLDPKLVKITFIFSPTQFDRLTSIPWQVEVYTLSSRDWRTLSSSNLPSLSIAFGGNQVVIDGLIYWYAIDRIIVEIDDDRELHLHNVIMSFDITSEQFIQVSLPDCLAHDDDIDLSIYKLKESLIVLEYTFEAENQIYGVWMMDHGVPNSFTKLFVINPPGVSINNVIGFRESGEPIIKVKNDKLFVYEPSSRHITYIGISGYKYPWFLSSYTETLLLLDH